MVEIADQRQNASIADLAEFLGRSELADQRFVVELPVTGVEDAAVERVDDQGVAFGNRMGERNVADVERADVEIVEIVDNVRSICPAIPASSSFAFTSLAVNGVA